MSFYDIDLDRLYEQRIHALILDIDNTMLPYYIPDPDEKLRKFIYTLKSRGFQLYIVSNGKEARVKRFNRTLGLPYVCRASKPSAKGFEKALKDLDCLPDEAAVIGDQIFTDVWGGNRMGMYTIMVRKVVKKDEWITAVKRPLEKIVLLFYKLGKRGE
jgi:HAD superfamily phosphatase (TIGR01668 family)